MDILVHGFAVSIAFHINFQHKFRRGNLVDKTRRHCFVASICHFKQLLLHSGQETYRRNSSGTTMEVIASRSPPYGWIILTFLYISFGLLTILAHHGEDYRLSAVRYATSFFMMGITFLMACHLGILATNGLGVLAFASLSSGYIFEGSAGMVFDITNGDYHDTEPNRFAFYLFSLITYFFWTLAAVSFGIMFRETWEDLQFKSWATTMSRVCSKGLILAYVVVFIASIWCMFFASVDVGDNVLDQASSHSEHRDKVALNYFRISIWIWMGTLFTFFLVTASALRPILQAIQNEADIIVWGLSSTWAADGIVFFQVVSSSFLIFVILEGAGSVVVTSSSFYYVLLAFNYSILVTYFFLHNVVFSLSHIVFDHDEDDGDDLEANGEKKDESGEDTSECSSEEEKEKTKTNTQSGHEVAEIEVINSVVSQDDDETTDSEHEDEALPTAGPGGIKTFLRMASMRKPEITRVRSSHIRFDDNYSRSMYSTSSYGMSYDNSTVHSSRR